MVDARRSLGQQGEEAAARFLRQRGFVILERNVRSRLGEIDLVARDGAVLVFVEIKARRAGAAVPPQVSVTARKQTRLGRLALGYLQAKGLGESRCRFDVVAVEVGAGDQAPAIRHIPGAFTL